MKAVIMAGGIGSRLKPLTCNIPKPLIPVANRPVMEYIIELLKKNGIEDICVTLQFLPENIRQHFGNGSSMGVNINYFVEKVPMGTAGSVKNAQSFLDDTFLIISGDVLTDFDLSEAVKFHKTKKALATIVLTKVAVPLEYGVVITDDDGHILRFLEKPSWGEVFSDTVNTGIYILEPEILDYIEKNKPYDFGKDLFPYMLKNKMPMYGYVANGYWCDIGNLHQYLECHKDVLYSKVNIKIPGNNISRDPNYRIDDKSIIGNNVHIGKNVVIEESVIGDNCIINDNTTIKRSIIWNNAYIGQDNEIRKCVLCNRVFTEDYVSIYENSVIGDDTIIKDNSVIKPDVKIWPDKYIDEKSIVAEDIIWGTRFRKEKFGLNGVKGHVNIELTPEFITKLGAVIPSVIKGSIGVSSDDLSSSKMLKNALIAGLKSTGARIYDFGEIITPIARQAVLKYSLNGYIHIKSIDKNENSIIIINEKCANIDKSTEKKIENLLSQNDMLRTPAQNIKDETVITDFDKVYIVDLLNKIDVYKIRRSKFKVNIGVDSKYLRRLLDIIMNYCGCKVKYYDNTKQVNDNQNCANADLNIIMDNNAEYIYFTDKQGHVFSDEEMLYFKVFITLVNNCCDKVVVPINSPDEIKDFIEPFNKEIVYAKSSVQDIMDKIILYEGINEIGQFRINFDGLTFLLKTMEYIAKENKTITDIKSIFPKFFVKKSLVECDWSSKGLIIRKLLEENGASQDTSEGVRINYDNGWAFVLPDPELPACRIFAEGYSEEYAEELTETVIERIKKIGGIY